MGKIDLEKMRSINFGGRTTGKSRMRSLHDPESGRTTGFEIDHPDGSQEAVVRPETIRETVSLSGSEPRVDANVSPAPVKAKVVSHTPGGGS